MMLEPTFFGQIYEIMDKRVLNVWHTRNNQQQRRPIKIDFARAALTSFTLTLEENDKRYIVILFVLLNYPRC